MYGKPHASTANRIAKRFKTDYNKGKGADVQTDRIAIEVEMAKTVSDAARQLQGHRKPVYVAGTNQEAVDKALQATERTTIGVMDNRGNVVKKSTRR